MSSGCDLQSQTIPHPSSACTCSGSEVTRAPCPAPRPVPAALAEIGPSAFWQVDLSKRTETLGERGLFLPGLLSRESGESELGADVLHFHTEKQRPREEGGGGRGDGGPAPL